MNRKNCPIEHAKTIILVFLIKSKLQRKIRITCNKVYLIFNWHDPILDPLIRSVIGSSVFLSLINSMNLNFSMGILDLILEWIQFRGLLDWSCRTTMNFFIDFEFLIIDFDERKSQKTTKFWYTSLYITTLIDIFYKYVFPHSSYQDKKTKGTY